MVVLSVIIVNHNTSDLLKKCLDSIRHESGAIKDLMEVIVVDNASDDNSRQVIRQYFPEVILLENNDNSGFGKANNQAIKVAKGENILLLNTDIEVLEGGIEKLLRFYTGLKIPSFAGGKLLETNSAPQPSCGLFYSLPVVFLMLFLAGDRLKITRYSPDKIEEADWVSGACLMGKKAYFEKIGLFDENIFMYMDEIDFLYRAKKLGFKVYFYPEARFIHVGSGSSKGKTEPVLNIYAGLSYFYRKHKNTLEYKILINMLKLKALLAIAIGIITGNNYLKNTYGKAIKLI